MPDNILPAATEAGLSLESLSTPLLGNRSALCAIPSHNFQPPKALKRLSINLSIDNSSTQVADLLGGMYSLTHLEVAFSGHQTNPKFIKKVDLHSGLLPWPAASLQVLALKDFRLVSNMHYYFSRGDVLSMVEHFPNLETLSLLQIIFEGVGD